MARLAGLLQASCLQPALSPWQSREHIIQCITHAGSQALRIPKRKSNPTSLRVAISAALGSQEAFWEREEVRWLREEQRWLREEQRWLREESRWNVERKALVEQSAVLLDEITVLKREMEQLKGDNKEDDKKDAILANLILSLTGLLKSLSEGDKTEVQGSGRSGIEAEIPSATAGPPALGAALNNFLAQPLQKNVPSGTPLDIFASVRPNTLQAAEGSRSESTKSTAQEEPSSTEQDNRVAKGPPVTGKTRTSLKRGSEGEDVRELQESLARLGFYSGEDDMEYSSFLSGTESAVKTWQATIGALEDGIVTTQLLARLFGEEAPILTVKEGAADNSVSSTVTEVNKSRMAGNDAMKREVSTPPVAKVAVERVTGYQKAITKSSGAEVSQRRVYLLGENRWEDPDRLVSKNGRGPVIVVTGEKCSACRGEGRNICTECEGTGELNVEEQFLEWAGEDAKCPYCEGTGSIICDTCAGKGSRTS